LLRRVAALAPPPICWASVLSRLSFAVARVTASKLNACFDTNG
jgi:hypothetical protein